MQKLFKSIFLALFCLCMQTSYSAQKLWTVLVYIAGDNDLKGYVPLDIEEMEKGSKVTPEANILVYLNIKKNGKKITQKIEIANGESKILSTQDGLDSGDPDTLLKALKWAHTDYSSQYFACILWDHGDGPLNRSMRMQHRGVCYDFSTGSYLNDRDYNWAFETACKEYRDNKKIDIIAFDACLMGNIEVAYALQSCANIMVSSQETDPGTGFNYRRAFLPLAMGPDPRYFASSMVNAFKDTYEPQDEIYTLSAIDLTKLKPLVDAFDTLSMILGAAIKNQTDSKVTKAIRDAIRNTTKFDENTYRDIVDFMNKLNARVGQMGLSGNEKDDLRAALQDVIKRYNATVINNVYSDGFASAKGLSIYFLSDTDGIEPSYYDILWSKETAWLSFLKAYERA